MYRLPHSGILANQLLRKRLNERGYYQSKLVPDLWKHKWRPVQFTLVVEYLGVKYVGKEYSLHLNHTLEGNYTVTEEWDSKRYIGITLDWNYKRRRVHLSIPGYVAKALKLFGHKKQKKQDKPYPTANINYRSKKQYTTQQSSAPPLEKKVGNSSNRFVGKFSFSDKRQTAHSSSQSAPQCHNHKNRKKTQCNKQSSCWTTQPLSKRQ